MKTICITCGKEFDAVRKTRMYCSQMCFVRMARQRQSRKCLNCGKEFHPNNPTTKSTQVFCSVPCRGEYQAEQRREHALVGVCAGCGETKSLPFIANGLNVCSQQCGQSVQYQKRSAAMQRRYRASARYMIRESATTCAICGTSAEDILYPHEMGKSMPKKIGQHKFHADHITPRANGGHDLEDNLRAVCWVCNALRSNMTEYDDAVAEAGKAFWKAVRNKVHA